MKILFYIESLRSGGKERRLVELIKGLKNYPDIEMELVLTREDIHYTDIFDTGIKIHYTIRKGLKKDPRLFWKFYKIAKKFKPDIIHVWGGMVAVYAIPAKVLLRIPMINNQIADAPLKVNTGLFTHKITFPFSAKIIANTSAGLQAYNAPKNKSMVIYNGFDFKRNENIKDAENIRNRFNVKTPFVVGMVASFSILKDYKTYIQAAKTIISKRKDITFLCVGSGDDSEYRKMLSPEELKYILFLGRQSNVESIMNICDVGVLTSNIKLHGEGISNALMEFSALSKPVIATNNGGTPEIITDGYNGFLVTPFDPIDLSTKIAILLNDKVKRVSMGINAKNIVEQKFGIKRMIEEFYAIYKNVTNE